MLPSHHVFALAQRESDILIVTETCLYHSTSIRNMFASGIGGGGFMTIRPADKKHVPISIDFRETAPTGSHPTMHANTPGSSRFGGLAVGVPGELRGLEAAYKAYGGAVSWQRLFEPAIKLAEGHEVGADRDRRLKFSVGFEYTHFTQVEFLDSSSPIS